MSSYFTRDSHLDVEILIVTRLIISISYLDICRNIILFDFHAKQRQIYIEIDMT